MRPHHARAIQRLAEHFAQDETCLGVIVGGSVAKGLEREDSDIDAMIVVTDDVYGEKWKQNQLFFFSLDLCDYPGGYVDGKLVTLEFVRAAAERGSEVVRAAFSGAFVVHSKVEGLEELVRRIPVYPVDEQRDKIQSFYAQFECAYWYLGEALRRNDPYLRSRSVSDLVLFGGRLILAHNQVLYPYHKFLMTELERAREKPENLVGLIDTLLADPSPASAEAFYQAIKDFRFWNEAWEMWQTRYMKDTELAWLENRAWVGDR